MTDEEAEVLVAQMSDMTGNIYPAWQIKNLLDMLRYPVDLDAMKRSLTAYNARVSAEHRRMQQPFLLAAAQRGAERGVQL